MTPDRRSLAATPQPASILSNHNPVVGSGADAVVFDRVSLAFDDAVMLRDVSFSVSAGHMTILIGASGVGKSVVLKLILGLLKPDTGAIRINGERLDTMTDSEMTRVRDDIGMLPRARREGCAETYDHATVSGSDLHYCR